MRIGCAFLLIFLIFTASSFLSQAQEEDEEERWEEYTEFTGTLNYILFGLAILILPWRYIYKALMKKLDSENSFRDGVRSLHSFMKNLHYIIGILAVLMITYHAYLVISKWNLALVVGLSLTWFYVITGAMSILDKVPSGIKKWTYRIHGSKIYLVITAIALYLGHVIVD
ncbi:MAG: hypothetical protein V5A88_05570 [Candidatus Thermoplasmatota archaeon]